MEIVTALLGPDTGGIVLDYLTGTLISLELYDRYYISEEPLMRLNDENSASDSASENSAYYDSEKSENFDPENSDPENSVVEPAETVVNPNVSVYHASKCSESNKYKYTIVGDEGECTIIREDRSLHYRFKAEWIENYRDPEIAQVPFHTHYFNLEVSKLIGWKEKRYGELTFTDVDDSYSYFYTDGKLNGTYEFDHWMLATYVDGLLHGEFEVLIGNKVVTGTYCHGMLHGERIVKNKDGSIAEMENYSYGVLHG